MEKLDFAHADLITAEGAPAVYGSETYVVACMPRSTAIARLEADLAPALKRFDAWYAPAQDALDRGDRPAFVAALANLAASMAVASPTLVQLRGLANGTSAAEQHLTSRWLPLVAASARLRAQVRFVLSSQTDARLQPAAAEVTEAFRVALAPLGSEVRLANACPAATAATYFIQVSTRASCERTSLGTTCRPSFELRGQECSSGREIFHSGLGRLSAGSTDPNGEDRALRRLVKKLDPLAIREELRAALKSELPGEESK